MTRKPGGKSLGRPSNLTDDVKAAIVTMLKAGLYRDTASRVAGIDPSNLSKALARGQRECEGPYHDFRQDVIRAEAHAEAGFVVRLLAEDNSPNLRWYLSCKWPEKYGGIRHILKAMEAKLNSFEEIANLAKRQQNGAAPE